MSEKEFDDKSTEIAEGQKDSFKHFWCCILLQALRDHSRLVKHFGADIALMLEPAKFILSDDPKAGGSVWICDLLGIGREQIRENMNSQKARDLLRAFNGGDQLSKAEKMTKEIFVAEWQ